MEEKDQSQNQPSLHCVKVEVLEMNRSGTVGMESYYRFPLFSHQAIKVKFASTEAGRTVQSDVYVCWVGNQARLLTWLQLVSL